MTCYKAIQPNGTDFWSGTVQWAPEDEPAQPGSVVRHPTARRVGHSAARYLSASTVATDCTGMWWPCRLLEVEPVDEAGQVIEPVTPEPRRLPNKRAAIRWRVVRELPAHEALGPQAEQIVALLERFSALSDDEAGRVSAQWCGTAFGHAWDAAHRALWAEHREAAWGAADDAAEDAPSGAPWASRRVTRDAILGLSTRDLIDQHDFTQEHYDALTGPWRRAIGPIHPDDKPLDTATPT